MRGKGEKETNGKREEKEEKGRGQKEGIEKS
jgi:hypothetical protein